MLVNLPTEKSLLHEDALGRAPHLQRSHKVSYTTLIVMILIARVIYNDQLWLYILYLSLFQV